MKSYHVEVQRYGLDKIYMFEAAGPRSIVKAIVPRSKDITTPIDNHVYKIWAGRHVNFHRKG